MQKRQQPTQEQACEKKYTAGSLNIVVPHMVDCSVVPAMAGMPRFLKPALMRHFRPQLCVAFAL